MNVTDLRAFYAETVTSGSMKKQVNPWNGTADSFKFNF